MTIRAAALTVLVTLALVATACDAPADTVETAGSAPTPVRAQPSMPDPAPTLTFSPSPSSGRGPIATPRVTLPPSPAPRATASRTVRPTSVGDPDRDVLVALYHATDGPNWANNAGWLSDTPLGEWHGVVTDRTGRVTRLALDDNQLIGEIPAALGRLDRLAALWLSGNHLNGADPAGIGRSLPAAKAGDPLQPVATERSRRRWASSPTCSS